MFPERVRTSAEELGVWGVDWTRSFEVAPSAVVFPETVEEVVAVRGSSRTREPRIDNGDAGVAELPRGRDDRRGFSFRARARD